MKPRCHLAVLTLILGATSAVAAQERPRFVNPATLPPSRGYTQLVEVPPGERLVFISGQVALDRTGKLVGAGDFRAQAEQVFENLRLALAEVGGTFADVVKITIFIVDVENLPELREVRDRYVNTQSPPASSLVEVRRLFREDVLLEVEAVAAIRGR